MAGSLNSVHLIGRLGQDPETRTFNDGNMIATLSVATSERWADKRTGEKVEKTEWHRVVVKRDGTARFCADYLRKGALIGVTGKLETRKWQDQSGTDRYTTEIVVTGYNGEIIGLDSRERTNETHARGGGGGGGGYDQSPNDGGGGGADLDDELPF